MTDSSLDPQPNTPTTPPQNVTPQDQSPQSHKQDKEPDTRRTSGLAITGLVLGIIGVVLGFIPIVNNVAPFIGAVGIVFAIIGIVKCGPKGVRKGRVMSIVATILCVLSLVITLGMQSAADKAIDDAFKDTTSSSSSSSTSTPGDGNKEKVKSVELQATATGKGSVSWGGEGSNNNQDFNQKWSKTIDPKDAKGYFTFSSESDWESDDNQKVTCTILVNGKQKDHKEASGQASSADCSVDFDDFE